MAPKRKNYTPEEKKIFIEILKVYKDVIETKKSDKSTLKQKQTAWNEVVKKYHNSDHITEKTTLSQLKKLWVNMKQVQRDMLTKEKQACVATRGGPQLTPVKIDQDIAIIAPNLMSTAPAYYSSNLPEVNDVNRDVAAENDDEGTVEYLEKMIEGPDVGEILAEEGDKSLTEPLTHFGLSSSLNDNGPGTLAQAKISRIADKRRRMCIETLVASSSVGIIARNTEKLQRITDLRRQDKELFQIRRRHEMKIAKVTECHLNVVNQMKIEHISRINELELRKATAEAEIAELRLEREKNNARDNMQTKLINRRSVMKKNLCKNN